jgi:hypothetical protein
MYKVSYTYDNPSGAGPFKGSAIVGSKQIKGEGWYGPFGHATITACSKVKESVTRSYSEVCLSNLERK